MDIFLNIIKSFSLLSIIILIIESIIEYNIQTSIERALQTNVQRSKKILITFLVSFMVFSLAVMDIIGAFLPEDTSNESSTAFKIYLIIACIVMLLIIWAIMFYIYIYFRNIYTPNHYIYYEYNKKNKSTEKLTILKRLDKDTILLETNDDNKADKRNYVLLKIDELTEYHIFIETKTERKEAYYKKVYVDVNYQLDKMKKTKNLLSFLVLYLY